MTPYARQWSRVMALHKRGLVTALELKELAARHQRWFSDQHIEDATLPMINDLMVYANHVEEFGATA